MKKAGYALAVLASSVAACGIAQREGASPVSRVAQSSSEDAMVLRRYVVVMKEGVPSTEALGILADHVGSSSISVLAQERDAHVFEAVGSVAMDLSLEEVDSLRNSPKVLLVDSVHQMRIFDVQNNPPSWGLDRIDQKALPLDSAYNYPVGAGQGVRAYIIDTGIDPRHPDFNGRVGEGFSAIQDGKGYVDCHGHGTHVAGTIAGTQFGIAKRATVYGVRVLNCQGSGTDEEVIGGIDWVLKQKNASPNTPMVANMSLGGEASPPLDAAVKRLIDGGVFLAVAAGNDSKDACLGSPSRVPEAVTVGASDRSDAKASFSNFGKCVDIYAPGLNITSAKLGGGSTTMSGTSMASPHVAGVGAVILGMNPRYSPKQIAEVMRATAVPNAIRGVPGGNGDNFFLQSVREGSNPPPQPTATPNPTPQPTATPLPPPVEKSFEGNLFRRGLQQYYVTDADGIPHGQIRIDATLTGPISTNFDVGLYKWDIPGRVWVLVKEAKGNTSSETLTWTGESGMFRWSVRAVHGQGSFTLNTKYTSVPQ